MSRPTRDRIRTSILFLLLFAAACTSLPFGAKPGDSKPIPTLRVPGPAFTATPMLFGPTAAGWIAFVKANNIWVIHPDGSGMKQVSHNLAPSDPATLRVRWSTDGQKLAFSYDGHLDAIDIGTLGTTKLADDTAGGFDWAAGGYQLIYDGVLTVGPQKAYDYSNSGLWVADARSGNTRLIVPSTAKYPAMVDPLWSIDTGSVIFSDPPTAKPGGQHLVNIITGKIVDLIPAGGGHGSCNWAPTSLTIACLKPSGSAWKIALLDANGNEQRSIALPSEYLHPSLGPWLADGSRLAIEYTSDEAGTQNLIGMLALDSGTFKALAAGRASDWSPDGRWMLSAALPAPGSAASGPITILNTTSAQVSALTDGFVPVWQPGQNFAVWQPSQALDVLPTVPAFCLDTMVLFLHQRKGYYIQVCSGSQHYQLGPLETGVYLMGPGGKFFLYASNSGYIYVARLGDRRLTQIGNIRNFIIIRAHNNPRYQFRFLGDGPDAVEVTELNYHEDAVFTIPRRITAP